MKLFGDISEINNGISELGYSDLAADVRVKKSGDGLKVYSIGEEYCIEYSQAAEFFRGMAIAADKIRRNEKNFRIEQKKNFDTCGVMIDVSRNAVLKVEAVKDIIRYMAKMGLNMLMLYTEDMYKMDKYPYFGYMRGAYTKAEIKEIVEYADIFSIEVIPCIQTLAHLKMALQWDYANDFRDTENILLADEPKTYEFIEEMIKTTRECFNSDRIHIGMDEAFTLGMGQYLNKHGYKERFEIISDHLKKVYEIVKKYDFKPIMWSDMIFNEKMPENVSERIPDGVDMVYWEYWNLDEDFYTENIKRHQAKGFQPIFAGGIHSWNAIAVNYSRTFATNKPALDACIKNGVKEVIATIWGDDGSECSVYATLLGMQLYAEYNYTGGADDESVAEMFKICTGCDMEAFQLLGLDTFDEKICPNHDAAVSKEILYQDVLQGLVDKNLRLFDFKNYYKELTEKYEKISNQGELEYLFDYYRKVVKVLYEKCDIGIKLTDAYLEKDKVVLKELLNQLKQLYCDFSSLHEKAAEVWYKNNKPFGFEVLEFRFGGLEARIKRAEKRVQAYIDGEIDRLEEFEEERLWYSGIETPFPDGVRGYTHTGVFTPAYMKGL